MKLGTYPRWALPKLINELRFSATNIDLHPGDIVIRERTKDIVNAPVIGMVMWIVKNHSDEAIGILWS